jgi:uncharacterized delta-60 repeat protein
MGRGGARIARLRLAIVAGVALLAIAAATAWAGTAGSLDPSFSGDGKRLLSFGNGQQDDEAHAVTVQDDGRIVVTGISGSNTVPSTGGDLSIARLRSNGSLDGSFAAGGRKLIRFHSGDGSDDGEDVALDSGGRIVVAGSSSPPFPSSASDMAVARFKPGGALDHAFSGDGKKLTSFASNSEANALAIAPNNKMILAGQTFGPAHFALARLSPNGSLDQSFSGDGRQLTGFPGGSAANDVALGLGGTIVAAGSSFPGGSGVFAVARYHANGHLDHSFSGDGKRTLAFGSNDGGQTVAVLPNGKVVVAGTSQQGASGFDFAVARLNPGGGLDHSFSGDGKRLITFNNGSGNDLASEALLQTNGKLVLVGGSDQPATARDFAVVRLNANGGLDHTFSGDGKKVADFNAGSDEGGAFGGALQQNGRILAVGSSQSGGYTEVDYAIARFLGG